MKVTKEKVSKNFTQIQNSIIMTKELTDKEKLLHMYYKMRENNTGFCWPSNKKVAEDLGWGLKTVVRAKGKLAKLELIDVRRRYDENIGPLSSRIDLRNMVDEDKVKDSKSVIYTDEASQLPDTHPEVTGDPTLGVEKGSYNNTHYNNTHTTKITSDFVCDENTLSPSVSDSKDIFNTILKVNEGNGVDTKGWRVNDEDELRLRSILSSSKDLEEIKDLIYTMGEREGLKYVSIALLHKDIYGTTDL